MEKQKRIETYILEELMQGTSATEIPHDKELINDGVLDSLSLMHLVEFMEEEFGATFDGGDITPENFQTINTITTLLEGKLGAAS